MTLNPNSTGGWNDDLTGAIPNGPPTSDFGAGMFQPTASSIGTSNAMDPMALGIGSMSGIAGAEGENNDEYWNALIDGELTLTPSSSLRGSRRQAYWVQREVVG
jgi:hypothetical protein